MNITIGQNQLFSALLIGLQAIAASVDKLDTQQRLYAHIVLAFAQAVIAALAHYSTPQGNPELELKEKPNVPTSNQKHQGPASDPRPAPTATRTDPDGPASA